MAKKISAEEIIAIYKRLDEDKQTLKSHWQEITDYMAPRRQNVTTQLTPGGKRMTKIYDSTAIRSLRVFANGLYGHLTSPAYPWFELTVKNKDLAEIAAVKWWLADATERLRSAINASRAAQTLHEVYTDLGWAGTACMYIEPGKRYALNFQAMDVANLCIMEDANGVVDSVYRCAKFSARQCIQYWGKKCSKKIKDAYEAGKYNEMFDIIHAIYPREDYDWNKRDALNMPWAVRYIEKESKTELAESGLKQFPYCVPRWEKDTTEVFGRSPGMDTLPDVKMLNQMVYDDIRARQKRIDPPLLASKESALSTTRTTPGSVIYHKTGEPPVPMQFGGDMNLMLESENQLRGSIERGFYADLFLLLAQSNDPNKTATEVRELIEEKLTLLGPALSRLQTELFDPMLSVSFSILYQQGYIMPAPEELAGEGLEIEYIGRLALAMKQTETRATANTLSFVGSMAQYDPSILDNFDSDEIAIGTAMRSGMPIKYIRPPDMRDAIRQQRAEQQAEREKAAMALEASKALPNLSKAPEAGSMAAAMTGQ